MKLKRVRWILLIVLSVCVLIAAYLYPHFANKGSDEKQEAAVVTEAPAVETSESEDISAGMDDAKASEDSYEKNEKEASSVEDAEEGKKDEPVGANEPDKKKNDDEKSTAKPKKAAKPVNTDNPKATPKPKKTGKTDKTPEPKKSSRTGKKENDKKAGSSDKNEKEGETQKPYEHSCTIAIECSKILSNPDKLAENKKDIIPADGVILSTYECEIKDGDSVFDVLKKAAADNNIHMEYTYTPIYNSVYIEGIANIYEFDCGETSGWTYSVNGVIPGVGCSSYKVNDGDTIVFSYTTEVIIP